MLALPVATVTDREKKLVEDVLKRDKRKEVWMI
jgi:hypothetical protein